MTTLTICCLLALGAPQEWEYGPDGWREVDRPAAADPAPLAEQLPADRGDGERPQDADAAVEVEAGDFLPAFDDIRADLDAGRGKRAFKKSVRWLQANPAQEGYDQALFLAARGLFVYGNRVKSFFYLDQLLDEYPSSPLWNDAIALQYQIADEYLDGYKDRFLGLPIQPADADGIEMLFRIRERVPLSPLGERALLRTGDYYYGNEEYDLAALVYGTYLDRFGRSPQAPRVKLRQAYSNLLQFEGPRYDPTPIIDARTQLLELKQDAPALAEEAGADDLLVDIDRQLAAKRLATGRYYLRVGEPTAAALEYQAAANEFPATTEGQTAAGRLREMGVDVPAASEETSDAQ